MTQGDLRGAPSGGALLEMEALLAHLERLETLEPLVDGRMWDVAQVREGDA